MAKKAASTKKKAAKRELVDTGTDKRFVRRAGKGSSRTPATSVSH